MVRRAAAAVCSIAAGIAVTGGGCVERPMVVAVYDAERGVPVSKAWVDIGSHAWVPFNSCRSPSFGGDSQCGFSDERGLIDMREPGGSRSATTLCVTTLADVLPDGIAKREVIWCRDVKWTDVEAEGRRRAAAMRAQGVYADVVLWLRPPAGYAPEPPPLTTLRQVRLWLDWAGPPAVTVEKLVAAGAKFESEEPLDAWEYAYRVRLASDEMCRLRGDRRMIRAVLPEAAPATP